MKILVSFGVDLRVIGSLDGKLGFVGIWVGSAEDGTEREV